MLSRILGSFLLAFHSIRSNFFHTVLSILGIVIGVAALVSILSLIDGMEKFARDQISTTTSLKAIIIRSDVYKKVNNVRIKKDTFAFIDYGHFKKLKLSSPAFQMLRTTHYTEVTVSDVDDTVGTVVTGIAIRGSQPDIMLNCGISLDDNNIDKGEHFAVVNDAFVTSLKGGGCTSILDHQINFLEKSATIKGVIDDGDKTPKVYVPFTLFKNAELRESPPELIVDAELVEQVPALKQEIELWLKSNFATYKDDFSIFTNEARVKQAAQGFLLFRIIMGLIVGISVLVGGIGVMNVLLISVTERTSEIGVRKAAGANRGDILLQFLCESISVSAFGSLLGLLIGVVGTMIIVPIVNSLTEIPFQAVYTWNTIVIVLVLALVVGIAFGTYPAIRASRLDPIEAIRRE